MCRSGVRNEKGNQITTERRVNSTKENIKVRVKVKNNKNKKRTEEKKRKEKRREKTNVCSLLYYAYCSCPTKVCLVKLFRVPGGLCIRSSSLHLWPF